MAHTINLNPDPNKVRDSSVDAIAKETETSADVVRALFEEQVAELAKEAKVKQFVNVIASKRVKEQIRAQNGAI
jgi:hypothetical protein